MKSKTLSLVLIVLTFALFIGCSDSPTASNEVLEFGGNANDAVHLDRKLDPDKFDVIIGELAAEPGAPSEDTARSSEGDPGGVPTAKLPRYESITAIRYVLEVPSGWFAKNGVAVGARVEGLPE